MEFIKANIENKEAVISECQSQNKKIECLQTEINEKEKEHQLEIIKTQNQCYSEMINIMDPSDLYCIDDFKKSILYLACKFGYINVVKYLLNNRKADINSITKVKSKDNYMFIYLSNLKNGKRESLTGRINPEDKVYIEKTALHISIEEGHTEIVQFLVSNPNIDINLKQKLYENDCIMEEKTPLYIAIEKENTEIIKILLSRSDIDINCMSVINTSVYMSNIKEEVKNCEVFTIKDIGIRREI